MEYIVDKTQKVKKLSLEDKEDIAQKICSDFKAYDLARASQIEKAQLLSNEIFFRNVARVEKDKEKQWKSLVKCCKVFMFYQIFKAFIWKNTYANPASMFDVSGETLEADNDSNKQKSALVDIIEKMDFPQTCDKMLDNALLYGELISFTTWKKHSEEYRRPISFFEAMKDPSKLAKIAEAKLKGQNFYIDERVDYDNPYVYDVDPANFVFDTTQRLDWDTCPKINRTWRTPSDIINNKYYDISQEMADDIREMVGSTATDMDLSSQERDNLESSTTNGSTIEVLEHWGDLTLKDGTTLKNWYAVVVGGKHLVCFEKNPFIINPFTYGAFMIDPANRRGISILYSVYDLAQTQELMINKTVDLQALNENPPILCPQGFFGKDPSDLVLHPGKIIEFDPAIYDPKALTPFSFPSTIFENNIAFIGDLMSEVSGIFPNMAGASESDRTTATEVSTKVEGQLTRLKMSLDMINQNCILPIVKNVAKLKANFTFGDEQVFINNQNQPENVTITDQIRQAEYRYTYSDRSATSERFNYADMVAQAIQMFVKSGLPANLEEIFTWYMEQKGVENPERFIQNINVIDPQVQQALIQNPKLAPIIQMMTEQVQAFKAGKKPPHDTNTQEDTETPLKSPELPAPEEDFAELKQLPGRNLMNR